MRNKRFYLMLLILGIANPLARGQQKQTYLWKQFVMGADLSYVNEIEDYGGVYKDNQTKKDPFGIFKNYGNNTVRVRLWHDPQWIGKITGGKLYSNLEDAAKTMKRAREQGMAINLNLHYADDWADPNQQPTPTAWKDLFFEILKDTVYEYTLSVLNYFKDKNLVPEMIQVGNETNAGMLWPAGKTDSAGHIGWDKFGALLNSGIKAVRDFSKTSVIKPQVIIHVAQLQYAEAWTDNIITKGEVTDFDILGLSHYYKWSTIDSLETLSKIIRNIKKRTNKKVMVVETAYPFTMENADSYNNLFGGVSGKISGFEVSKEGQLAYLKELVQQIINGGGSGIMYWEPAWITSAMKDRWGLGSSWENAALFDFEGNVLPAMQYMQFPYSFPPQKK